jgi:hypothetical protein
MSSARAFKLIKHLSEAVIIEEEMFEETDELYKRQFASDFCLEEEFIKAMELRDQQSYLTPEKVPIPEVGESMLKKLHKKLAMKTHPDLSDGDDEEFKLIQLAFESGDCPALLAAAMRHDVDLEIEESDIQPIMRDINNKRKTIENKKNTFRWAWGESDRSEKSKKLIRAGLLIEEEKFQQWLKTRNVTV